VERPAVALATSAEVAELEEDERALPTALRERGVDAVPAVWDAPDVDWSAFDLVVVRAAWDYAERRAAFLAWAASLPHVLNPLPVLEWTTDKQRYLRDLAEAGLPVVPTRFVGPDDRFESPAEAFVVKPAISAGGRSSARFGPDGAGADELVSRIHSEGRTAMVQPDLGDVTETALVFIDRAYSHALRRRVALPSGGGVETLYLEEDLEPGAATREERELAARALALAPGRLLYGRVDLVRGLVTEVELAEPSLYLDFGAGALERFADAIARQARAAAGGGSARGTG
jgi:glutathione synthase/RimK-type ligase-like ATP-grasp enzyme